MSSQAKSKPLSIPIELKGITQYVRRAEELDKDNKPESRLVAYYCRQYAVTSGISLSNSPASKTCLSTILTQLETEKVPMSNFSRDEAQFLTRKFALDIFSKADNEDRAGLANKNTARTFYAAAVFLEILQQFGTDVEGYTEDLQEEDKQKRIYSKWKATEIVKAIKEGRSIAPGGYGEVEKQEGAGLEEQTTMAESQGTTRLEIDGVCDDDVPVDNNVEEIATVGEDGTEVSLRPPPPLYPSSDAVTNSVKKATKDAIDKQEELPIPGAGSLPLTAEDVERPPLPSTSGSSQHASPSSRASTKASSFGFGFGKGKSSKGRVSEETLEDVCELTTFALSALKSKDVDLGAERLEQALSRLGRR